MKIEIDEIATEIEIGNTRTTGVPAIDLDRQPNDVSSESVVHRPSSRSCWAGWEWHASKATFLVTV